MDTSDDDGWTPLIIAASAGHNQLVEMLLANGANVNATTSQVEIVKYTFSDCRRQCNNHLKYIFAIFRVGLPFCTVPVREGTS